MLFSFSTEIIGTEIIYVKRYEKGRKCGTLPVIGRENAFMDIKGQQEGQYD